jgi:carbonic anhydrase
MGLITDELIGELLEEDLETAVLDRGIWSNQKRENTKNTKPGSSLARQMKWHTFTDLEQSVVDDVKTIKHHELVPNDIKVKGFIFNLEDHELRPVVT